MRKEAAGRHAEEAMSNSLSTLSAEIADTVARAAGSVAAVHGRARYDSSGIVWGRDIVVTSSQGLQHQDDLQITGPSGKKVAAEFVGRDVGTDIAVLRVKDLDAAAPLRSTQQSRPGDLALVVGRNGDTGTSAGFGVVSGVGPPWRTWRGGKLDSFIRLDVGVFAPAIGGAVVNVAGELLGMATTALTRLLPVAVPVATLDRVVDELVRTGRVARGYLGVGIQPVSLPANAAAGQEWGLIVLNVQPNGPAERAGVLLGDVLLRVNGKPISDHDALQDALAGASIGHAAPVEILRAGSIIQVTVEVAQRPQRS